jgi:ATP-dependent Clp protease ATP-binding subunit ClpC
MTSNVGAEILQRNTSLAFQSVMPSRTLKRSRTRLWMRRKKSLSLNSQSFDRDCDLPPIAERTYGSIVELELEKVSERLKERKLVLDVSEEAKEFLIEHGYDNKLGARPLRRAVEKYLEDNLAEALLSGDLRKMYLLKYWCMMTKKLVCVLSNLKRPKKSERFFPKGGRRFRLLTSRFLYPRFPDLA